MTDTNQASEDEIAIIEKIIRFNCPMGCDGNGSYPEMGSDGDWDQGQCQWCFEYGMPAREAIQHLIRNEKLKLLAEVREAHRDGYMRGVSDFSGYFMDASIAGQRNPIMPGIAIELREAYRPPTLSTKLEAEL